MDQKNTIVKCTANPSCLFNHNGICDNYVITIGADGSCQEYVETEEKDWPPSIEQILQRTIDYERDKRAETSLFNDIAEINDIGKPMRFLKCKICASCKHNPTDSYLCERKKIELPGIWACYEEDK